ncbi:MAG TPA: SDR family NAD(P)-dependent oxidoreductase [Anaeromyxobacteraceae bacterium]|nr:SDR family NAD(P)-dependent oxidoreductase [Anaeromyxobacteraceae bacterium]
MARTDALRGRVALVTGAAGGIGRAVAAALAAAGARVVVTARRDAVASLDLGPGRAPAAAHLLDVRDAGAWERVLAKVEADLGGLDVLVNNAGIVDPGPLESIPAERLATLVDTNLLGTILGCRAAIPAMRRRGGGVIVNLGSLGGIVPMPFEAAYAASKAGLRHFSLSLRAELEGSGIRVVVVSPDSVDTPQLVEELRFDEASLSFASPPLAPGAVARAVVRAVEGDAPEVLVPAGGGLAARVAAAFPRLWRWLVPMLRRGGRRRMERMRAERGAIR